MIELSSLQLKNFLSHVDTSLDMQYYRGLVLIEGRTLEGHYSSNGSGKSTILEGIVYALTGDTLRGVSVNDVINRNYKKNTSVALNFCKDGTPYSIKRYRKDDIFGDSLIVNRSDENISKRVNKDTQKLIEDTLGISYRVLSSTMLLGEGLSSRFTQLSDPEKKSLIESTLNLNYDMNAIRAKANSELTKLKLEKSGLEGRLSTLKEFSGVDIDVLRKEYSDAEYNLTAVQASIESKNTTLKELQARQQSLSPKLTLISNSILQHDNLSTTLKHLDEDGVKYHAELLAMEEAEDPHCTVCHQSLVSEESKDSYRANYAEKIKEVTDKMKVVMESISALPDRSLLQGKYEDISSEFNRLSEDIRRLSDEIYQEYQSMQGYQRDVAAMKEKIENHEKSTGDISVIEQSISDVNELINKYDYFYRLFSPTGIIVNVLSEAVSYINTRLTTYSDVLLEKNYRIEFLKGKISLVDDKGSSYQSLSNGEKRRLDLSVQFALHDYVHTYCGLQMDTIFIDEVLDTLDDVGTENIIDVLRLKLEYCHLKSIYVITHNNTLKSKFDQVVTVCKKLNGDSYLNFM